MRKSTTLLALLLGAMAFYTLPASAQSTSQTFRTNFTTGVTIVSPSFPNVGQSLHVVYACVLAGGTSTAAQADVELEASSDGVNYFAISPIITLAAPFHNADTNCQVLTANGYFAAVRLSLTNTIATGLDQAGVFTALYMGSIGSAPAGGEVGAGTAATKTSAIPVYTQYTTTALKSAPVQIVTAATNPASTVNFIYDVIVQNPNASTPVFVQLGATSAGTSTAPSLAVPVTGGGAVVVSLANPIYIAENLWVACSTSMNTAADPASACNVQIEYVSIPGVNSDVDANGFLYNTDGGPGVIPH